MADSTTHDEDSVQKKREAGRVEVVVGEETDGFGMWRHAPTDMEGGRSAALLTALSVMVIYYKTLSPSITGGDSGEVMAAACSWGPAHPPGYPLFVVCANFAMWLFASLGENKAYRVNLMCAIMTATGTATRDSFCSIRCRRRNGFPNVSWAPQERSIYVSGILNIVPGMS